MVIYLTVIIKRFSVTWSIIVQWIFFNNMNLMDLPIEVFCMIVETVVFNGLDHAMVMRLVCSEP